MQGREAKIALVCIFHGIGVKYSRNMFMDMYHADFIDSIAIDGRIQDILTELEIDCKKTSYEKKEEILINIAKESNLSPWQLDRLLYNFKTYYLHAMRLPKH
jgi:hypothetical protein